LQKSSIHNSEGVNYRGIKNHPVKILDSNMYIRKFNYCSIRHHLVTCLMFCALLPETTVSYLIVQCIFSSILLLLKLQNFVLRVACSVYLCVPFMDLIAFCCTSNQNLCKLCTTFYLPFFHSIL